MFKGIILTSIAIYRFTHPIGNEEQLWAIGDTRITANFEDASKSSESITSGAKIFSIPVRVSKVYAEQDGGELLVQSSIGMAYAGNATLGLNLYAQLSQILPHLVADDFADAPIVSLLDIVKFATTVLQSMTKEMNQRYNSWSQVQTAEIAFFGSCPADQTLQVYTIRTKREMQQLVFRYEESTPTNAISAHLKSQIGCVLLGDKKKEIAELIRARTEDLIAPGVAFKDVADEVAMAPKYVLEALIHHDVFPTIGRGLQIMIAGDRGVYPYSWGRPQSVSVPSNEYEMYSLYNFNVIETIPDIGKTRMYYWPCVGPDYDVDVAGFGLMSEFHQELRRLMGKPPLFLFFR